VSIGPGREQPLWFEMSGADRPSQPRSPRPPFRGTWRSSWTGTAAGPGNGTCRGSNGHRAGAESARRHHPDRGQLGIKYLTPLRVLRLEWNRPKDEVDALMKYLGIT